MLALSIVAPHGANIAAGRKTLEVRSWRPEQLPLRNLLIVENGLLLSASMPVDPAGRAVAIVDIAAVHAWQADEVAAACASGWQPGYWAWQLSNIRPLAGDRVVPAQRKLYVVQVDQVLLADYNAG